MTWEEELKRSASRYVTGWPDVNRRRAEWKRCVEEVLLPTLERAAAFLQSQKLLPFAKAEHHIFGTHLESVQLHTGSIDTGIMLDQDFAQRTKVAFPLVMEVGATLGYSLGVSGHVRRWHIEHWFSGLGPSHPAMQEQDAFDPSKLTVSIVESHVLRMLEASIATSFLGRGPSVRGDGGGPDGGPAGPPPIEFEGYSPLPREPDKKGRAKRNPKRRRT